MAELIIVFREVLEGALIVGILYTYLNKTEQHGAIKWLWQGVTAAIVASILGSILFQIFADGFEGRSAKLFEGIVMILAAAMLGTMIVWMAKNRNIAEDLKEQAEKPHRKAKWPPMRVHAGDAAARACGRGWLGGG